MSDNYDGPQMAQKIMRQQAEIERLRIKNARLRALLTKRLEFLEERACEEFEPECAWCQSHQLWLEITHELALEDSAADQPAAVRVCDTCGNPVEVMPFKTHAPHHEPMQHVLCDVCKTAITERRRADQPAAVYERPKCDCLYPHPAQYVPNFCGVCHGVIADKPDVTHGGSHEADQD